MKQYLSNEDGSSYQIGNMTIPAKVDNRHYQRLLTEVVDGEAEVVPYSAPALSPKEVRDQALNNLVHDFGDGRVIQVRKKDEQNIRNAMELMTRHGIPSQMWLMADNAGHPVTASDLQEALESGQDQGATAWAVFFAATSQ